VPASCTIVAKCGDTSVFGVAGISRTSAPIIPGDGTSWIKRALPTAPRVTEGGNTSVFDVVGIPSTNSPIIPCGSTSWFKLAKPTAPRVTEGGG